MELNQKLISRDYSKLPKEYWKKQNLCWYLHDILMSMFTEALEEDLIKMSFKFKSDAEKKNIENVECIYEWLKRNGREKEFVISTSQNLAHRLLGDFLNYIYESLSNLERGKIAIAYDLLRKPFKDNLMYLEWIFYNDSEICNLVYEGDIEKYVIAGKDGISKEKLKNIIKYNVENNRFKIQLDAEIIYNIRFNANSPYSMELMWNKATHLVTTRRQTRTKDFNYLFLNEIDYKNYWKFYYEKIPILLLYTIGVVENIFDKYYKKINDNNKLYNYILITSKTLSTITESYEIGDKILNCIDEECLYLPCKNCNKMVEIDNNKRYLFYDYWNVVCSECGEDINICKYFFMDKFK